MTVDRPRSKTEGARVSVVVTARSGFDLGYVWKGQRERQAEDEPERQPSGGYYIDAAQAGEQPGRWFGRGAEALDLAAGQVVERETYEQVYRQVDPRTGERLGRSAPGYAKFREHLARLAAAEPYATAERLQELERQAAQETRKAAAYTDMTVSISKSVSVLDASFLENARRAELRGDTAAVAHWQAQHAAMMDAIQAANRAGLEHVAQWAATRTGHHGGRVNGQEPGRYEATGLIVSSWLQGTSRDGDPQLHVHNQISRMSLTARDGKWRAVDTMSVRAQLGAVRAIVAAHLESELTRRFGVEWEPRADGLGNEVKGITQAEMDAYSTRTQAITAAMPQAVADWTAKWGRTPNRRELLFIANEVTMATRLGKDPAAIDWTKKAQEWDARLGGALAGIAPRVTDPGAGAGARGEDAPRGPSPEAQARVIAMALARVQQRASTWTRADLMREMAPLLPASARELAPDEAVALLHNLTDRAIAGETEPVVCLDGPEWPPLPDYLRRGLDGRSVYTRPGVTKYSTDTQLRREEQLTETAQRGGAPCLTAEACAQELGSTPAALEAALHVRAQEASEHLPCGLRLDQGAAVYHALTSDRTVSLIVGPAGSGKTRALAEAASMWPGPVVGLAPSQAARNVLAAAAEVPCYNTARFLGHTPEERNARPPVPLEPGTLVMLDEGSMTSLDDIRQIAEQAAAADSKVVITGDHGQLTAVEGGGGMAQLARGQEHTQLADPVRFRAEWERDASLRLREGDTSVLTEYGQHARVRGGPGEEALEDARRAYVAAYVAGRDILLMAQSNEVCADLSQRIREDLQHLGLVDRDGPEARLSEGARASVGDLIITRENDHRRGLANGDTWRIEEIHGPQVVMRRALDCDRETGDRQWAEETVTYYDAEQSAELAYVITGHSAQGRTVREAHALIAGSETREWAYVALTRATDGNYAHVITPTPLCEHCGEVIEQDPKGRWVAEADGARCAASASGQHGRTPGRREADPAPGTRPAPELARRVMVDEERSGGRALPGFAGRAQDERAALGVLSDVLGLEGQELSASETLRRNLADADHLGRLATIWEGETGDAVQATYERLLRERLPEEHRGAELSAKATWLWRSLRSAEAAGLDAGDVLEQAISSRSLDSAHDIAAVIDDRVREQTAGLVPQPAGPWSEQVPEIADPARQAYVAAVAEAIDERTERLGEFTAEASPIWARHALGAVPDEPLERLEWEQRAKSIARYREMYGYADPVEAIGPEPTSDSPQKRAVWHAAFAQLGPVEGVDVRGEPDGRLLLQRRQYESETAWAPRWVGDELRYARTGTVDATQAAERAAAEERAAAGRGDQEQAGLHGAHARSAQALQDAYRTLEGQLADAMDARAEWERTTTHTRHLAIAADTEYRRRHPETDLEPLRSAEPPRPTEEERAELEPQPDEPTYQTPGWVGELAAHASEVRERIADRESQRVPAEDHEWEDEGHAWPRMVAAERDAILQPPQPEIRPAPQVEPERAPEAEPEDEEAGV
jgi:conjugative relaxase-like TrwC/TraI family protein